MVGTAFGVSENNILAAGIFQHNRTDIAGMRAFFGKVAILSAHSDFCAAQSLFDGCQQRKRRADQKFTIDFAHFFDFFGNAFGQSGAVSQQAVHFPVSGNQ